MGTFTLLKNGASTEIFSPVTASEITGNSVPQSTAKQLASRIRLLNMKLDSRERTLSSASFATSGNRGDRGSDRCVAAMPIARNEKK